MPWKPIKQDGKWYAQDPESGELRPDEGFTSKNEVLKYINDLMVSGDMAKNAKIPPSPMESTAPGAPMMPPLPPMGAKSPTSGPDMAGLMDLLQKKAR